MPIHRRAKESGQAKPLGDEGEESASTVERSSAEPAGACYQAALKLLTYRARAEAEMKQRLSRKGFAEADIERTVERLKAAGLIDDAAFAKAWTENRAMGSPRSAYVVKRELRTKGIDADTAEEASSTIDDPEAAYRAALPRLNRLAQLPGDEARHKLADFLRRRGFGWAVIERTISRLREEGLSSDVDTT